MALAVYFFKGMVELVRDILCLVKTGKTWFFGVKPRPQKPVKPSLKNVLRAHTIVEQEALLCTLLKDPSIPSKKAMLQVLSLMRKDHLHRGHDMLFEKLLYEEALTQQERKRIFSDYAHLSEKEQDILFDFLNENALEARMTRA